MNAIIATNNNANFRISLGDLYLDEKLIFSVPIKAAMMDTITLIRYYQKTDETPSQILVGTGTCCNGHIYTLYLRSDEWCLANVIEAPTNVMDMIPASIKNEHFEHGISGILLVGYGCSGEGVFYTKTTSGPASWTPVFDEEKSSNLLHGNGKPIFLYDGQSIRLGFHTGYYRPKPGKVRDLNLPSILVDSRTEEWVDDPGISKSMDLTEPLSQFIDIGRTISRQTNWTRLNR